MITTLPAELTIARATEVRDLLLAALTSGAPLSLDGRAVEAVDAAGLQVLCAARRSAELQGTGFGFTPGGRSAALTRAIEAAGLTHLACGSDAEGA